MAHYVKVPKDFNNIKEKFMFNLTKRQVVCFAIGGLLGAPLYFLTKDHLGMETAVALMGLAAAPAIFCGVYCRNGIYLEQMFKFMLEFFKKPRKRYYKTVNMYECIENQLEYNRLKKLLKAAEEGKK